MFSTLCCTGQQLKTVIKCLTLCMLVSKAKVVLIFTHGTDLETSLAGSLATPDFDMAICTDSLLPCSFLTCKRTEVVQVPKLEEQLLLSLLPQDEADQRDIVLEVLNHQAANFFIVTSSLVHLRAFAMLLVAFLPRPLPSHGLQLVIMKQPGHLTRACVDTTLDMSKPNLLCMSANYFVASLFCIGNPRN